MTKIRDELKKEQFSSHAELRETIGAKGWASHFQSPQPVKIKAQKNGVNCTRSPGKLRRESGAEFRYPSLGISHNIIILTVNPLLH